VRRIGRKRKTNLANPDQIFWNDPIERIADAVILLDEHTEEVDFVRDALEEEKGVDGVRVGVEEGGEEVGLFVEIAQHHEETGRAGEEK
jgi:hypothetical protein